LKLHLTIGAHDVARVVISRRAFAARRGLRWIVGPRRAAALRGLSAPTKARKVAYASTR
jgi:hypothetical protein